LSLKVPIVMGILNITPDSFSDGGRYNKSEAALSHVAQMLEAGASIIDIGGYSSRPNAADISVDEELARIYSITEKILREFPDAIISIDTFRTEVARPMLELGVHIINDISGGLQDPLMMKLVSEFSAPYVIMHKKGNPQNMQQLAAYDDVLVEVERFFIQQINQARSLGIKDIILDPGFGFAKKIPHNYQLLLQLECLTLFDLPILVGLSRKSMLYRLLNSSPGEVLASTAIVNFKALEQGANILRVHDVKEAMHSIRLYTYMQEIYETI